ncbi:MAG: aminotransferase class IV [Desulfovibrionaceae bacterium]|nr:aminotransferase class IV [Desulfovibrionaceae bacterium]
MIHYRDNGYTLEPVPMDPAAPAFRCGAGFFETLYCNGGEIRHLEKHLDRIFHSLRTFDVEYETVDFEEVIAQVLNRNGLTGQTARVNIFYPMGADTASPVVTAAPHEPKPYKAYRLCVCKNRHVSMLNGHKTTNAMFAHLALRRALSRGFDEVALFDLDCNILQAAEGALAFKKEGAFVCVDSPYRQPSIALDLAGEELNIQPARIGPDDLPGYRHAYILNSLIGMRPVVSIGETAFVPDDDACAKVMRRVLGE